MAGDEQPVWLEQQQSESSGHAVPAQSQSPAVESPSASASAEPEPGEAAPPPSPGEAAPPSVEAAPPSVEAGAAPAAGADAAAAAAARAKADADALVKRTRLSGLWIALGCFAIVLVFLLIFIVQNDSKVNISYLGVHGQLTLGIAMLWAALAGIVLTLLAGTARILQLRAAARRRAKH